MTGPAASSTFGDALRVEIIPDPGEMALAAAKFASRAGAEQSVRARTRRQLGLPLDGAVIMTGHQAAFWHAGILGKYVASDCLAEHLRGAGVPATNAHIVVDHDAIDAGLLYYPTRDAQRNALRLVPPTVGQRPVCMIEPMPSTAIAQALVAARATQESIVPAAALGLRQIQSALDAHANAANAAHQVAGSVHTLMRPLCDPGPAIFASTLSGTDAFEILLREMHSDAPNCIALYNQAAARFPRARVAPLALTPDRIELPLWRLDAASKSRIPVFAHELATIPPSQLAPRALLMTAFLRAFVCDFFIHGLGGGLYDQITNAWLGEWKPALQLAPTAVVTATLCLPFDESFGIPRPASPGEIAKARWTLHRAMHDPALLGDVHGASEKSTHLARIAAAKAAGESPLSHYRALHIELAQTRARHADQLTALESRAAHLSQASSAAGVVYDRTWPFPYHGDARLNQLAVMIRDRF